MPRKFISGSLLCAREMEEAGMRIGIGIGRSSLVSVCKEYIMEGIFECIVLVGCWPVSRVGVL